MSNSTRDQRCTVYAFADAGVDGMVATSYVRVNSGAPDKGWWARIEAVNATESRIAEQQSHRVDVLIEFADEVAGLSTDGTVRHLASGIMYNITGIRKARDGRAVICHATEVDDEVYANVVETP